MCCIRGPFSCPLWGAVDNAWSTNCQNVQSRNVTLGFGLMVPLAQYLQKPVGERAENMQALLV